VLLDWDCVWCSRGCAARGRATKPVAGGIPRRAGRARTAGESLKALARYCPPAPTAAQEGRLTEMTVSVGACITRAQECARAWPGSGNVTF